MHPFTALFLVALLLATAVGNKKIVKHLLRGPATGDAGVDVNQKNGKGYTALVTAIQVPTQPPIKSPRLARSNYGLVCVLAGQLQGAGYGGPARQRGGRQAAH